MEDVQFDNLAKTAADGGRRHLLKALGASGAAGLFAFVAARGTEAKDTKGKQNQKKNQKPKEVSASARPVDPGKSSDCCAPCPGSGNPCIATVRDLGTGQCVRVEAAPGMLCGSNRICRSGRCTSCDELPTPPPSPNPKTFCPTADPLLGQCVDTTTDPNNCGTCGNVCASGSCVVGDNGIPECAP
jgi:hypothetical protein